MCVGVLHDSPRIRRDARNPGRQAIRLRIVLRLPLIHERFRRGQNRNGFAMRQALSQISHRAAALPDSRQIRVSIGQPRRWTLRRACRAAAFARRPDLRRRPPELLLPPDSELEDFAGAVAGACAAAPHGKQQRHRQRHLIPGPSDWISLWFSFVRWQSTAPERRSARRQKPSCRRPA